ncbi:suppressor of cytokine signaling 4-like [Heteronotia binoei]|uniref:suppressor of cytokine signaling 4-like n=1 Tax=Heteronotia binoei TaxID=13085 RepID=UPI00292FC95A|nr:suppressor of cytokine signaling 4-like [Heteronotia binoei]
MSASSKKELHRYCPLHYLAQERQVQDWVPKHSELDLERSCGHRFLGRSLKQKLQDAVGQCFPIKNCSSRHSSVLPSKRKIHISELMLDKCPFPPRSELAFRWHLIKRHTSPIKQKSESWLSVASSHSEGKEGEVESTDGGGPAVLQASSFGNSPSCSCDPPAKSREESDMDSDDEAMTLCASSRTRNKPRWDPGDELLQLESPPKYHTQIDYFHCLVPDLQINDNPCYWGVMDKYAAEMLLDGKNSKYTLLWGNLLMLLLYFNQLQSNWKMK